VRLPLLLALLAGLFPAPAWADPVRAADYDAFWLWAGVRAGPQIEAAKIVYLLQGEIAPDGEGRVRLKARGAAEPGPHQPTLWLVYRAKSLDWPPEVVAHITARFEAWRVASAQVAGVQIDFDASTRGLQSYAAFLRALRRVLPAGCRLSVTGLMDWASRGAPEDLDALSGSVDEVIFQTYRGRETVRDIDAYLARLGRVTIPFRLGLAEGALWSPTDSLAHNPHFKGYVVFLRN